MHYFKVRKFWVFSCLLICMLMGVVNAATYNLTTGESVVGDLLLASANDVGVQVKLGDGDYRRLPWSSFSQDDLKKLSENAKLQPFVEPFIEISQEERLARTDIKPVQPDRLALPEKRSLIGAMFSSSLGLAIVLLLYAANIYAGYEVAIYRGNSVGLVMGVSALLPVIGPIVFFAMPAKLKEEPAEEAADAVAEAQAGQVAEGQVAGEEDVNPMRPEGSAHPTALHLAHEEPKKKVLPKETVYQRGQFTFNRRFFETRFPGFFGAIRREGDKDMVLVFKTPKGEFVGERITRVSASDLHIEVKKGAAVEEVTIPFSAVQEIRHKHKDA